MKHKQGERKTLEPSENVRKVLALVGKHIAKE